jgi:choice-of-anchor B domain-containing protein
MKKFLLFFLVLSASTFSQLGNFNMYLIKNLDTHRVDPPHNPPWQFAACWGYVAPDGREYAILGCVTGTQIVDITDSANVREVYFRPATINFSNPDQGNIWREMKVYSHYLYVVSEADTSGIEIFDLANLPDSVRYVGKFFVPGHRRTHTISQQGPYLYLNGANNGFGQGVTILDLTNPEQPVKRGAWNVEYVHDSRTINDTLFTSNINNGKLAIFDVANKDSIKFITSFQTVPNPFTHNSAVTKDRKYIFTTDETSNPPGKLKVWNIENLSNITFVTNWQPAGITNTIVHNVEIYGDTAVIAHYQAGIRVLNISNPALPVEIAWYDTYPGNNTNQFAGCWGVYKFPSGKIIGSDMNTGLYVVKMGVPFGIQTISNEVPSSFNLEQNYPNPFNPNTKIKFSVADQKQIELRIFDITGKEVSTLVNQQLKAGVYEYDFSAKNLTSGVYIYKLTAGDFSSAKKMVLVK